MENQWDEFSKSLSEPVPRRESFRLLGAVFAGAVLGPLGLGTAWARQKQERRGAKVGNACQNFCRCRNPTQQKQCLAVCQACNNDPGRLGGACGSYVCCAVTACNGTCSGLNSDPNCGACGNDCRTKGQTCCGGNCVDLSRNLYHCGRCGNACTGNPPPHSYSVCIAGACAFECADGAIKCAGTCTLVRNDPRNCGACGNVCGAAAPFCSEGKCVATQCFGGQAPCNGICREISLDPANCGACGVTCGPGENCVGGVCQPAEGCTADNPYYPNC